MTVTLRDVAQRAGVSTAATSQALNDCGNLRPETRARIKEAAAELGYTPNRNATALRRGRTLSVGFVMAEDAALSRRRALQRTRQLNALVSACAAHGFTVTVLPDSRPDLLAGTHIDVLYFSDPADSRDILHEATRRGIPISPVRCIGRKVMWRPANISQKAQRPARSDRALRLTIGVQ